MKYVVAKKGMGKRAHRPAGVQGPYKVVDKRMKTDNRKQKMQDRKKGNKGNKGNKGGNKGRRKT